MKANYPFISLSANGSLSRSSLRHMEGIGGEERALLTGECQTAGWGEASVSVCAGLWW